MALLSRIVSLCRNVLRQRSVERSLDAEVRAWVEMVADEHIAAGLSPADARRAALIELGGLEPVKESVRAVRAGALLEQLVQDVRYALRLLAGHPGFTAVAVLTIALGIGVNATIFALFDAIALRPLEIPEAHRVVSVYQNLYGNFERNVAGGKSLVSYSEYLEYRDHNEVFAGLAAYVPEFSATLARNPVPLSGQLASCNYFDVLKAPMVMGRGFSASECATPDERAVVVLSYELWRNRLAADPAIVGKTVVLNRVPLTVIGVAGPDFHGTEIVSPLFWAPLTMHRVLNGRSGEMVFLAQHNLSWLALIGRLKDGVTLQQARANLRVIAARIDRSTPGRSSTLSIDEAGFFGRPDKHKAVFAVAAVVQAAVGLVLLIACANVANLFLARAAARKREIAVRLAMGASRGRIVRQLLTESLVVAGLGGALGTLLAMWSAAAIAGAVTSASDSMPLVVKVAPDFRIFAYALALTVITGTVFGLAPALQATRPDVNGALKQEDSHPRCARARLRHALVGLQVAVCMVLLIAAGLLLRGLYYAQTVDPGFSMDGVAALTFDLQREGYTRPRAAAFHRDLLERLRAIPGVDTVAEATTPPLGNRLYFAPFSRPGANEWRSTQLNHVTAGFFASVNIPLTRGRDFTSTEAAEGAPVIIVNETAARLFWPGQDPLGQRLQGFQKTEHEVVGVARDAQIGTLGDSHAPYVFFAAGPSDGLELYTAVVHGSTAYPAVAAAVRTAALSVDPDLHCDVAPLRDNLKPYIQGSQILAEVSGLLAGLALLLAAMGIYSTVSYTVGRRTREIGIRMALGGGPSTVMRLILRQSMQPVAVGALAGIAGTAVVSRILTRVLFGVSPLDAIAFVSVPAFLAAVALTASYVPARRALRVDPMIALRHE